MTEFDEIAATMPAFKSYQDAERWLKAEHPDWDEFWTDTMLENIALAMVRRGNNDDHPAERNQAAGD